MRITADIIDEEITSDGGACAQAPVTHFPKEAIEQLEADLKKYAGASNKYSNAARSPANEYCFSKMQNDRYRDMCSRFSNLNISGEDQSDDCLGISFQLLPQFSTPLPFRNADKERTKFESTNIDAKRLTGFSAISKMDEAKPSSSKGKSDVEAPSPWMMEFLTKMKQEIKDEILEELTNLPRIEMQAHSSTNGKADENQYQGDVVHPGIYCDNCDQLIHGIRYKCGNCTDFDLCQECESLPNIHNKNHIFLKIRFPVSLKLCQKQKWQPFILPSSNELLTSGFKSYSSKKLYEAKFVCDETVPDGTVLSPSTTFIKRWRVLNSGKRVWTHSTKLQHIQGSVGLTPASEQVDVPHLRPGEEGIVSVLFTTPAVPGVYRSHWNFCHKSRPFGHIVWCHIVVKDTESEEKCAKAASEPIKLPTNSLPCKKEEEVASIAKVLTAVKEEHEKGNLIPRKLAVNSHTATPNNTPFDLTPPKSPDHQAMNELKVVMEDKESISALPVTDYDAEEEGSVVSLSSSDSDAEFVVIPMPNCFNLSESFASHNILSQFLQSDNVSQQKDSKSTSTKSQNSVVKPIFSAETVSQETGVPELSEHSASQNEVGKGAEQKILISHNISGDGSSSEISIIESGESSPTTENAMPEISSIHIAVTNDEESKSSDNVVSEERRNSVHQEVTETEEPSTDIPGSSATFPKFPVEGITSIYEPASSTAEERTVQVLPERIMTVPLNVASTVYNATMQVMTNLRRPNADAQRNQEGATGTVTSSPMNQLVEMGFCNRQQNEDLLKKHKNDVANVVADLVNMNDNEWYASRHVPPSAPSYN